MWAYKQRGLYPGGLISRIKKKRFKTSHGSVDQNTFFKLKTHKATFSPVQYCHPAEGAYNQMYLFVSR